MFKEVRDLLSSTCDYVTIVRSYVRRAIGRLKKYAGAKLDIIPLVNQNVLAFVVPAIALVVFVHFLDILKSAGEHSQSVYFDGEKLKISARIERDNITGLEVSLAKWRVIWSGQHHADLELDSFGGAVDVAERIARMIEQLQRRGIAVRAVVPRMAVCMSSCTMILAAASERVADPSALFMFHGVQWENRQTGHGGISPEGNAIMHLRIKSVDTVFDRYLLNNKSIEDFSDRLYVLGAEMESISCHYVSVSPTYDLPGRLVDNVQRNLIILGRPAIPARMEPC